MDAEAYQRLAAVESKSSVNASRIDGHEKAIDAAKEEWKAIEARIMAAGKVRETHILEKVGEVSKTVRKVLWVVGLAALSFLGDLLKDQIFPAKPQTHLSERTPP